MGTWADGWTVACQDIAGRTDFGLGGAREDVGTLDLIVQLLNRVEQGAMADTVRHIPHRRFLLCLGIQTLAG